MPVSPSLQQEQSCKQDNAKFLSPTTTTPRPWCTRNIRSLRLPCLDRPFSSTVIVPNPFTSNRVADCVFIEKWKRAWIVCVEHRASITHNCWDSQTSQWSRHTAFLMQHRPVRLGHTYWEGCVTFYAPLWRKLLARSCGKIVLENWQIHKQGTGKEQNNLTTSSRQRKI